MPGIKVRYGKGTRKQGQVLALEGEDFVFGRGRDSHVRFALDDVSRAHCRVTLEGGIWWVRDLKSQNGLFVNDLETDAEELQVGDDLMLGVSGPHVEILELTPDPQQESFSMKSTRVVRVPKHIPPPPEKKEAPAAAAPETPAAPGPVPAEKPAEPPPPRRTRLILGVAVAAVVLIVLASSARRISRWMRAQAGIVSLPEIPEDPGELLRIPAVNEIEAAAGGGHRWLRLRLTSYSRAGKKRGEKLDVIETHTWFPVRVSSGRPVARAAADNRGRVLPGGGQQPALEDWLRGGDGDQRLVSWEIEETAGNGEPAAGEMPPTKSVRREGEGPTW